MPVPASSWPFTWPYLPGGGSRGGGGAESLGMVTTGGASWRCFRQAVGESNKHAATKHPRERMRPPLASDGAGYHRASARFAGLSYWRIEFPSVKSEAFVASSPRTANLRIVTVGGPPDSCPLRNARRRSDAGTRARLLAAATTA